ncbi:MAG: AAA domain-containing protein [Kofleriaceae bacterium]
MSDVLDRFVAAFKRGIEGELAAMKSSTDAFEIRLGPGEDLGDGRYSFALRAPERLERGTGCILKARTEQRVVIERVSETQVVVQATAVDLGAACSLIVAPWFLYDRLITALDSLTDAPLALTLFGKTAPVTEPAQLLHAHPNLDPSQRAAVELCVATNLAFVWGPPGTGKTVTLVEAIDELLARGERILLASTTNAAIDQVLAKLSTRSWFAPGVFVRLGRSDAPTYGTELADLVEAARGSRRDAMTRARARIGEVEQQLTYARALREDLVPALTTQQSLFSAPPPRLRAPALARVFSAADAIASTDAKHQMQVIDQRITRLEKVRRLTKARIAAWLVEDRETEAKILGGARVVLCTLANAYLSPLLVDQTFDVLIAEEAGMATLPALFVAAAKCTKRAIMVGDPRQLPPIVQSDDDLVRRAIGRSIFDVTVPQPETSPNVALLSTQYRMAPPIGALVGGLFYGDRLTHAASDVAPITARAPFPDEALVVVDVPSTCARAPKGSSRINLDSAARTIELAHEAVLAGHGSIAVITPYAAQAVELRRLLVARKIADAVECATVHRFQGRECDVVILDLVDAAPLTPSALVNEPNLLNVSISRARGKLVIVADVAYWTKSDNLVARLLTSSRASRLDESHRTTYLR